MCWADKLAVLWGFVVVLCFLVLFQHSTADAWLYVGIVFIAPVWVFLRLVDWVVSGPAKRRGTITGRVIR